MGPAVGECGVWSKGLILAGYILVGLHEESWKHFAGTSVEWGQLDGEDPQENVGTGHMVLLSWFLQVSLYQGSWGLEERKVTCQLSCSWRNPLKISVLPSHVLGFVNKFPLIHQVLSKLPLLFCISAGLFVMLFL